LGRPIQSLSLGADSFKLEGLLLRMGVVFDQSLRILADLNHHNEEVRDESNIVYPGVIAD
jgi:hypothetical protein